MIVGADVSHPGVGSVSHCPSVAAVVASCDKNAAKFLGSLRLQSSKQEMIEAFDQMIVERLRVWYEENKSLPNAILVYRDGVSESQFAAVKTEELLKIKSGCEKARRAHNVTGYSPNITIVVCGKRHRTRFLPASKPIPDEERALDKNKNHLPGLVVDDPQIRSPWHYDFYLQSQRALKGTARPCHYFVIENQMTLNANQLQAITYNLCWIFATAM